MEDLWRITRSMAAAARSAGVFIVTGDTKVVNKGHGDGVFINTAGIGLVPPGVNIAAHRARPGNGPTGRSNAAPPAPAGLPKSGPRSGPIDRPQAAARGPIPTSDRTTGPTTDTTTDTTTDPTAGPTSNPHR